jgi:ABC-2 type transport system ATP-binding protein
MFVHPVRGMSKTMSPEDRPSQSGPAVVAEGLIKQYGETRAVDGLDLEIQAGTVCGLLGPNGAGKTTTVRILATLLRADGGRAEVAGLDVRTQARAIRAQIGLTNQHDAVDEVLTGRQNLELFGRLHRLDPRAARHRADELLEQFGLTEAADRKTKQYSGGMQRRLDLAASFIMRPRVLFLDEPTTGQDPRNRNEVWDVVRSLVADGTTVLLTTHYLDEADQLADQISVIDRGRVIADGTPDKLKAQIGGDQIDLVLADADDLPAAAAIIARVSPSDGEPDVDRYRRRITAPVHERVVTLTEVLRQLEAAGISAEDVALRRPTLDEVFLRLTGRPAEGEATGEGDDEEAAA